MSINNNPIIDDFIKLLITDTKSGIIQWFAVRELTNDFDFMHLLDENLALNQWQQSLFYTNHLDCTFFAPVMNGFVYIKERSHTASLYTLYIQPSISSKIFMTSIASSLLKDLYDLVVSSSGLALSMSGEVEDFIEIFLFSHNSSDK